MFTKLRSMKDRAGRSICCLLFDLTSCESLQNMVSCDHMTWLLLDVHFVGGILFAPPISPLAFRSWEALVATINQSSSIHNRWLCFIRSLSFVLLAVLHALTIYRAKLTDAFPSWFRLTDESSFLYIEFFGYGWRERTNEGNCSCGIYRTIVKVRFGTTVEFS